MKNKEYWILDFDDPNTIFESNKTKRAIEDGIEVLQEMDQQSFKVYSVLLDSRMNPLVSKTNLPTKTHPFQAKWAKTVGLDKKVSLHAEIRSLIYNINVGEEYVILVMRLDNRGRLNIARPCEVCSAALYYDSNVQYVIYTNEQQQFILEPISNFKTKETIM